jgi:hypothetical protein
MDITYTNEVNTIKLHVIRVEACNPFWVSYIFPNASFTILRISLTSMSDYCGEKFTVEKLIILYVPHAESQKLFFLVLY